MNIENLVPESWGYIEIENILAPKFNGKVIQQGWSPRCEKYPSNGSESWGVLKTTAIQEGLFLPDENKQLPSHLEPKEQIEIEKGDILMTCAGPRHRCGVVCLVTKTRPRLMMSGKMYRFRPFENIIDSKYVELVLRSQFSKNAIDVMKTGINDSGLNLTHDRFKKLLVPIAPLNEQHRIVAKIEELFSELDKGIESLKTAREQLKVYRQALLKQAFEGKLTEQWRKENADKLETADQLLERIKKEREVRYQQQLDDWELAVRQWEVNGKVESKPAKPKKEAEIPLISTDEIKNLPFLPKSWSWARPQNVSSYEPYSIGIGPFGSNLKVSDYTDSGVPLVFVRNITNNNFDTDLKYISDQKYASLLPHTVKPLDILVTKMGDPPGDAEIYPRKRPIGVLTADCLKFRVWPKYVSREYFKHCINSVLIKKQLGVITKGVAQKKISVGRFKTLLFPCPSILEQNEIVSRIDASLSDIQRLENELQKHIIKCEALRQSILKKAFSGQLVPQDPNDEPASILLERISAEKAEAAARAKQAKSTPKKSQARKRKAS